MREYLKKARARAKANGGFTLIELMAVLAILALIAIIAVPAIGGIIGNAEDSQEQSTKDMIEKAAEVAYVADSSDPNEDPKDTYKVSDLVSGGYMDYESGSVEGITDASSASRDVASNGSTFTFDE